ncbi:MAG TPA: hypothetical protein VHD69_02575 [Candidatus Paceibacterota bacterium]|jgi:hypothetical protein|nr:hypothetical protein [Candidatus Paceibacterota bacterium]
MHDIRNTLEALQRRLDHHEKHVILVGEALTALKESGSSLPNAVVFEVHCQKDSPNNWALREDGEDLSLTIGRATQALVSARKLPAGARCVFELFLRIGDFRVAVLPEDARDLVRALCPELSVGGEIDFDLDRRLKDGVAPMVFGPGVEPPGWYQWKHFPVLANSHWKS